MQDFERKFMNRFGMEIPKEDYAAYRRALAASKPAAKKHLESSGAQMSPAHSRSNPKPCSLPPKPHNRTCRVCKERKPLKEFEKDSRRANGLSSRCKSCASKQSLRSSFEKGRYRGKQEHRIVWMANSMTLEIFTKKGQNMIVLEATPEKIVIKS